MNQTDFHKTHNTSFEVSTYEKIKRLLDFEHGPKQVILDVGSGSGILDSELAKFDHKVTGIDVQEPTSKENWSYIKADINLDWPAGNESFDLVICTDVAEHMYNPQHVLEQAARVLKPNGQLIFGVPNHFDLRQRLRMLFGQGIVHWDATKFKSSAWDYGHIRFFTIDELEHKFAKTGWHIQARQFNFMGAGILPSWLLPDAVKTWLLEMLPGLFSGKFIYLVSKQSSSSETRQIYVPKTKLGM